jgi:glycosyltransferase involved in cell wall biosynthesis
VRIFHKELKSLVKVYPDIHLIVADGLGDKLVDGIQIHDIGKPSGRKERFLKFPKLALKKALQINADLFHLHDPELLMIANGLKANGGKAIYDSHEDLPRQIMSKTYIPKILRKIISGFLERFENRKVSKMYGVIAASNKLFVERFAKVNTNGIDIHNYPKRDDIDFCENWDNREMAIGYIGGIFKTRGIIETLDAIEGTDIKLLLAGNFSPADLEIECKNHPAWENVEYFGFLNRQGINDLLKRIRLGLVILEATPSYVNSLPVKMFEYMAAGLPVVASNFPMWIDIIESTKSGIFVDQTDSLDIRTKIQEIITNVELLKEYGRNGRQTVLEKYNWEIEEERLIEFYKSIEY